MNALIRIINSQRQWHSTHVIISKGAVKDVYVKVELLIDGSSKLWMFRVELIVAGVLLNEVSTNCPTFGQNETLVIEDGHLVLRVQFQKIGFQMITSHHINHHLG